MLGFFPSPYKDEVIFGLFTRYHKLSGNTLLSETLFDLFGDKINNGTISNIPGRLNYLHSQLNYDQLYTPEYLLDKHTIFPIYTPFLPNNRIQQIIHEAKSGNASKIPPMLGEISGDITKNKYAKFCNNCYEEAKQKFGEYYFNRIHQFPGNEVCHIHNVPLQKANVGGKLFKRSIIEITEDDIEYKQNKTVEHLQPYFYNLSTDIDFFFHNDISHLNQEKIHKLYRNKLNDIGMIDRQGSVFHSELSKRVTDYYLSEFLNYLGCSIKVNKNHDWLKKITRNQYDYIHPLRHILFIRFLFGSVMEFYAFYNTKIEINEPFGTGPWPCLNPVANHYKENTIPNYKLSKNSKPGKLIGIFECSCGYSYSRAESNNDLDRYKKGVTLKWGEVWETKFKEYLIINKFSINKISALLKCQSSTLLRCAVKLGLEQHVELDTKELSKNERKKSIINSNLELAYKNEILQYIKKHPQTYMSEVKQTLRKQFAWLRYHCKDWLTENISLKEINERYIYLAKERVDWEERDKMLVNKVKKVIERIKAMPNYPKITVGLISNEMDKYDFNKQMAKLPLTKAVIMANVESTEESQKRRIIYIVEGLHSSCQKITRSIVIQKANLSKNLTIELDNYINKIIEKYQDL